jgi:CubicO group peptidase (beta-lactamase class C family)
MIRNRFLRSALVFALAFSFLSASLPTIAYAQPATAVGVAEQYKSALSAIEEKVEARRKELGIPGMSLLIVKDDKVIYAKGFGFKVFEH